QTGFNSDMQDVTIRSTIPVDVTFALSVGAARETITVEAAGSVVENVPGAHSDVDASTLFKLPLTMAGSGLSEAITMMAPGVVNDSNGFFHPLGDHASYSMQLDGQPINDQFSKRFSKQVPLNVLHSTEFTMGLPSAG